MLAQRFYEDDEPAIRKRVNADKKIDGWSCPSCGSPSLLRSDGDLSIDNGRVEIYCDNLHCEAREIIVLIKRGLQATNRADVAALRAVENGTVAEQEEEGYTIGYDEDGRPWGRSISLGSGRHRILDPSAAQRKLKRRTRRSYITVEPFEDELSDGQ